MKNLFNRAFLIVMVLLFTTCKKSDRMYDCYFYTDIGDKGPWYLYLDGDYKGELPNLRTRFSTDNDTLIQNALHIGLRSGNYKVETRDRENNIKNSGTTKFKPNSMGSSSNMGAQATMSNGKTIVYKLYE